MRITIVTPSFNQASFLEETIQSILAQNYEDLEYFIIDGGSTDGSVEIIKKYEKHLTYWVSEKDNGQSEALNKGFRRATGEVLTWINSDDILLPGALQAAADAFSKAGPEIGLIYGGARLFDDNGPLQDIFHTSTPCPEAYTAGMIFAQPASFFRREALEEVGLINEGLHYGMDYDLFCRLSLVTRFQNMPQMFAKYRLHRTSKTVTEFGRFVEDWKRVFVNLCKNLEWKEVLNVLHSMNYTTGPGAPHAPYRFTVKTKLDPQSALYHHLCFLQYKLAGDDRVNESDNGPAISIPFHFSESLFATNQPEIYKSILFPIFQSLQQEVLQPG